MRPRQRSPLAWDTTWTQWKRLVGAKIGIDCTVAASGEYVSRSGEWKLVHWQTALPLLDLTAGLKPRAG